MNSSDSADLDRLIEACGIGDRDAMQQVYERCSDRVYALMVRIVGRQDADDLTQQVFLQMFRKLDQFSGDSKFETWLYRVATNEALQHLRRRKREPVQSHIVEATTDDPDHLIASEEVKLIEVALSRLEPELRAVLVLKEHEKLSYREIAESVGIPEGTVGSRLNRAKRVSSRVNEARLELNYRRNVKPQFSLVELFPGATERTNFR